MSQYTILFDYQLVVIYMQPSNYYLYLSVDICLCASLEQVFMLPCYKKNVLAHIHVNHFVLCSFGYNQDLHDHIWQYRVLNSIASYNQNQKIDTFFFLISKTIFSYEIIFKKVRKFCFCYLFDENYISDHILKLKLFSFLCSEIYHCLPKTNLIIFQCR